MIVDSKISILVASGVLDLSLSEIKINKLKKQHIIETRYSQTNILLNSFKDDTVVSDY